MTKSEMDGTTQHGRDSSDSESKGRALETPDSVPFPLDGLRQVTSRLLHLAFFPIKIKITVVLCLGACMD